jgi:glycosyltransferase involved in cell wall biosynthesis
MRSRINILVLFLHSSAWGVRIRGDERRFLEIVKRFIKFGAKLNVIEYKPSLQLSYYKTRIYRSIELKDRGLIYTILWLLLLALRIKGYDIIYAYNQDLFNILGAIFFKLFRRKPLVIVVQSLQDIELPLKIIRQMYGASAIDMIFIILHRYILLPLALNFASIIFTVSNSLKRKLTAKYPSIKRKIVTTLNGVDTNKFHPINLEKEYDAIFLGRIHITHKGIDKLLLAWKYIINRHPQAKLVIVGGFESERDKEILYRLVEKLGIRDNVIITGFIDDDKVVFYLNKTRAFISLSTYEGFGLSILEALACVLPVITTDLDVLHELHGDLLFYVATGDIKSLAKTLENFLTLSQSRLIDESLIETLEKHVKSFSWNSVAYKEFIFINKLVKPGMEM